MKSFLSSFCLFVLTLAFSATYAVESPEVILSYLLSNGQNGQTEVVLNKDGSVRTIYIVAAVSHSNTVAKKRAIKMANKQARIEAEKILIRTLNALVKSETKASSSVSDGTSGFSSKETISEIYSSSSMGAISGLTLKVSEPDRDGEYIGVFIWNAKQNIAVTQAGKEMAKSTKEVVEANK